MLPLSHPKSTFHISGNRQKVSHLAAPRNLFLCPVTRYLSCSVLRGHLSLSDSTVGTVGHFVPLVTRRHHWDKKGRLFASRWLSVPHSMVHRLRMGSDMSQGPLSDSSLGHILRNWKFWPCKRPGRNTNWGTLPPQKWLLNGTLAFAKRGKGLRISLCSVASPSPSRLCLSSSDFLDDPYSTFHIQMIARKGFWGSLWSKSFSYIQKPEGKNSLNILKNPLLTMLLSQVEREQSFPPSWAS